MKFSEIKEHFLDYYATKGYHTLPRTSMMDSSIPMSFVMSAGAIQVERSLENKRVLGSNQFTLVQDCFRHFDLEKIGKDDIHLSFFEMPGAFSFEQNNKSKTIKQMWELATSILGIEKSNLWASYFRGGSILRNELPEDNTVRQAWLDIGLPSERIIGLGVEDNYWIQGKGFNGKAVARKSGPNTELFFDRGIEHSCGSNCQPSCNCGRFVEFSNSLFIRYDVDSESGHFRELDKPFSETVIGSERVAMILQNKKSIFEIDIYTPLLQLIREFSQVSQKNSKLTKEAERIIADHLRALVHLIYDDAPPPGKNGRARLIKKLIRGIITAKLLLEVSNSDFLSLALNCIIATNKNLAPNNKEITRKFFSYYAMQEKIFIATIERGKNELKRYCENRPTISGQRVLFLEKTIGFPCLLVEKELKNKNIPFPRVEYDKALKIWKNQL